MPDATQITEATGSSFAREVLDASSQVPVLVDFWAAWCQPCRQLSPVLQALAAELTGKLKVVKVNTDQEQQLAAQYGIRSLPTVLLFKDGQVADQFSGLIPKGSIEDFLRPHLPRESDRLLQQAREASAGGDSSGALSILEKALAIDPDNYRIHPELVRLYISTGEYRTAEQVINSLPVNQQHDEEITRLRARLGFLGILQDAPGVPALLATLENDPGNLQARYQLSAHQFMADEYETAMDQLLQIIREDRSFADDGARKALLDIFTFLGNSNALVKRYRSKLAAAIN